MLARLVLLQRSTKKKTVLVFNCYLTKAFYSNSGLFRIQIARMKRQLALKGVRIRGKEEETTRFAMTFIIIVCYCVFLVLLLSGV